jgi:hypothetical protein
MKLFLCTFALLLASGTKPLEEKKTDDSKDEAAKEEKAKSGAQTIVTAVKKYYVEMGGEWPAKLDDIAKQLENGKKDLIDPWGKEYKFAIVKMKNADGTETERPYVWTERTVDGKTKVYGMKPPEEKKKE